MRNFNHKILWVAFLSVYNNIATVPSVCHGLTTPPKPTKSSITNLSVESTSSSLSRREVLKESVSSATAALFSSVVMLAVESNPLPANALEDIDNFLKTGMVAQPMGVSGQVGCFSRK
jgi:hypothetical protein